MLTKAEIKHIRSLGEKKFRDATGQFVVEGEKLVQEALESSFKVAGVYRREEIGEEAMSRISQLSSPPPVLAVLEMPVAECDADCAGLCLALDSVRDPGNVGTLLRLADWFGVDTVYASSDTADIYNPKVVQASMGSLFRVRFVRCDIPRLCRRFTAAGLNVWGTFLDGENIYSSDLKAEGLVVMGNEASGISPSVASEVGGRLTIPSFAHGRGAESLNVAAAAAVVLSEFRRR